MSYILDALKKLESEKGKKARGDGMLNISGELFRDEPRRSPGGNAWKVAAVVAAASLITFGATWYLLKDDKGAGNLKPAAPSVVKSSPVDTPPQPPLQPPVPSAPAAAPIATPQAVPVVPPAPVAPQVAAPTDGDAEDAAPSVTRRARGKRPKERREAAAPSASPDRPAAGAATPPPVDIKVSGIAWQDDRRARRAVVNGFLMHEGGVVAGAAITEILQDRVRFSLAGSVFEVPLMTTVPGTGK
ncbi:MAG: hypothetical protein HYV06_03940 [Deltaproteobacteria bacterium]|nr:hypothetical protein [Deltaproteobacteria bacterium]